MRLNSSTRPGFYRFNKGVWADDNTMATKILQVYISAILKQFGHIFILSMSVVCSNWSCSIVWTGVWAVTVHYRSFYLNHSLYDCFIILYMNIYFIWYILSINENFILLFFFNRRSLMILFQMNSDLIYWLYNSKQDISWTLCIYYTF